ncbi:unnamed protein product [Lactuca saligna]|uniref:Uncharacterized protein n=1 Tax=Lactuca saligna TaxID=75948 RepID=A0AA35YT21_LACSI|nr:unnamed protein product [Lactuca saligna]
MFEILCSGEIPGAAEEDVNVFVDAAHKALQISSRESIFNHGSYHTRTDTSNSSCFAVNACSKKPDQNIHLESKVLLEPIEMTCDPTYLVNFVELYIVLASFQSHEGRVLGLTTVTFSSNHDVSYFVPDINVLSQFMRNLIDENSSSELLEGTQIQDLYDLLEIKLVDFQINLFVPFYPTYYSPILENLNASSALALCIVQDESLLKAMEVYVVVAPFSVGSVNFRFLLRKVSILLTDEKWSSDGPLLEILMGSLLFHGIITANVMEGSVDSELQVLWEPFLEPWKFQLSLRREQGKSALQNSPVMTDVHLESTMNLNNNVTESLIEVILTNATTMPFEVRFDILFGVSPKILDPVYPGHEFPLPLHLAE